MLRLLNSFLNLNCQQFQQNAAKRFINNIKQFQSASIPKVLSQFFRAIAQMSKSCSFVLNFKNPLNSVVINCGEALNFIETFASVYLNDINN